MNFLNPTINIFNNFLGDHEWRIVKEYCLKHKEKFFDQKESNWREKSYSKISVVHKEQTHSTNQDVSYMRAFLNKDSVSFNNNEQEQDRIPKNIIVLKHYLDWPEDKCKHDVIEILSSMTKKIEQKIYDLYLTKAVSESGPWISVATDGMKMNMHVDGYPSLDQSKVTKFSSVYYINEDFVGGDFFMPVMGFTLKPKENSLLLFSECSHEDMAHQVNEVKSGYRFVSQGFFFTL